MPDPETAALAAYWRFFDGTNSRDAQRFTDALNFPHVRISARSNGKIVRDAPTHAGKLSFDAMIETGWDHSVGLEPEVLQVASSKVHIKGGWTRYNADNEPIMTNMVTYIATLVDDHWGMQSRLVPTLIFSGGSWRIARPKVMWTLKVTPGRPRSSLHRHSP